MKLRLKKNYKCILFQPRFMSGIKQTKFILLQSDEQFEELKTFITYLLLREKRKEWIK